MTDVQDDEFAGDALELDDDPIPGLGDLPDCEDDPVGCQVVEPDTGAGQ